MDCRDPTPIGLVYPSRTLIHLSFLHPALGVQVYESNKPYIICDSININPTVPDCSR